MKYRKKPVVIEATQYFKGADIAGVELSYPWQDTNREPEPIIRTLEGVMVVQEGDWIITGIKGEIYPCKPDIFAAAYEPVTEFTTNNGE